MVNYIAEKGGAFLVFWLTKGSFTKLYPDEVNFEHFSPEHFVVMGICAAIIAAAIIFYRRLDQKGRDKFIKFLALALIADELWKHIGCLATGQWNPEYLPFHLCSINLFICCWCAIKPNDLAAELLYATCLPGALIALLMPTWNVMPYWNFMTLHSNSVHILLATFPLVLLFGGFKPSAKRLPKVAAVLLCECVPIYFFNKAFNTNFFFLNGTENNGLLEALVDIFGEELYIIGLVILLAVVWALMYLPWYLIERKTTSKKGAYASFFLTGHNP